MGKVMLGLFIGIFISVQILLIALKCEGILTWDWEWILSPLIGAALLGIGGILMTLIMFWDW